MSVIETALRRRQAPHAPARPAVHVSDDVVFRAATVVSQPESTAPGWRRHVSPATLILAGLAVATFVIITRPGWGAGFQHASGEPAAAPAQVAGTVSTAAAPVTAATAVRETPTQQPILGPPVDLADVLVTRPATPAAASVRVASSASTSTAEPVASVLNRYQLGGVMMTGSKRLAVVNGAVVEEGQRVGHAIVTTIGQRDITIDLNGTSYRIPLRSKAR